MYSVTLYLGVDVVRVLLWPNCCCPVVTLGLCFPNLDQHFPSLEITRALGELMIDGRGHEKFSTLK